MPAAPASMHRIIFFCAACTISTIPEAKVQSPGSKSKSHGTRSRGVLTVNTRDVYELMGILRPGKKI